MNLADLTSRAVAGAVAGALTVTGIQKGDILMLVQDETAATANIASEFTVTDNTITNIGGTSTNGHTVIVVWEKKYGGGRFKFPVGTTAKGRSTS